jgi:RNA polymerase sigma factor (sigma-70 family)
LVKLRLLLTDAEECRLAFRWQHCRDHRALRILVESFQPLLFGMASDRLRTAQLGKMVKVINGSRARNNPELADHFQELMACGQLGLLDAANRFDGRARFSTYAKRWAFKRMQEYVLFNWNVVRQPEPENWKRPKDEHIPPTHPTGLSGVPFSCSEPKHPGWRHRTIKWPCWCPDIDGRWVFKTTETPPASLAWTTPCPSMNPFENPLSLDKRAASPRHTAIEEQSEDDEDGDKCETEIGRYRFEFSEYQALAHESMEALERAIELETKAATLDTRLMALARRKHRILRGRFPWASDWIFVEEEECGEYLYRRQRLYPRRLTREFIGAALGISDERVRQIEVSALYEIGLKPKTVEEPLIDRLVELLFTERKKRWLAPRIVLEEEVDKFATLRASKQARLQQKIDKEEQQKKAQDNWNEGTDKCFLFANYHTVTGDKVIPKKCRLFADFKDGIWPCVPVSKVQHWQWMRAERGAREVWAIYLTLCFWMSRVSISRSTSSLEKKDGRKVRRIPTSQAA